MIFSYPHDVPELPTDRLRLRAYRESDLSAFAEMMADPDVARYLASGTLSRADAWRQLALFIGHWVLRGYGLWAVEEVATGRFIGRIGCWYPEGWPALEVGYGLARHAWGHGYAREAAAAALTYAREVIKPPEIVSIIRPDNRRSIRVAESLGATAGETIEFAGGLSVLYRYPTAQS